MGSEHEAHHVLGTRENKEESDDSQFETVVEGKPVAQPDRCPAEEARCDTVECPFPLSGDGG